VKATVRSLRPQSVAGVLLRSRWCHRARPICEVLAERLSAKTRIQKVTAPESIDSRQARGRTRRRRSAETGTAAHGTATTRKLPPEPHVQKADCQLAAKGAADAEMEVNVHRDRSKSAERSRRPLLYPCDQALQFWSAELRRAFARR